MQARRLAVAALDRAMLAWMRHAPAALAHGAASALGGLAGGLYPRHRARAAENLAALRPDLPPAAIEEAMGHLARTMCESAIFDRFQAQGRVTLEGAAHLQATRLFLSVHTGCWPLAAATIAHETGDCLGPHQPPPSRLRAQALTAAFSRVNGTLVEAGAARLHRRLCEGGAVIFYVDENKDGRVAAPSLGRGPRMGGNIEFAVRLARLTGQRPVLVHVERLPPAPGGPHFRVVAHPPMDLPGGTDRAAALRDGVAMVDAAIEPVVRGLLPQWFMLPDFRFAG